MHLIPSFILLALAAATVLPDQATPAGGPVRLQLNINPAWRFQLGDSARDASTTAFDDSGWQVISLPHTMEVCASDLTDFAQRGRQVGWYRRVIRVPAEWADRRVFVEFQGAMQTTRAWVNGVSVGEYAASGYDSFHFDITERLRMGDNMLVVRVDNTVNPDIPPDGQKTDFIPFGGLYRDVRLVVTDPLHITFPWEARDAGVRLTLPGASAEHAVVRAQTAVRNDHRQPRDCALLTEIVDREGRVVASMRSEQQLPPGAVHVFDQPVGPLDRPHLWSPADPYLYEVHSVVLDGGRECDRLTTRLGVRWFRFDKEKGFFLNDQPLKLVGANRHQTWPFIGNAVPNSLHRFDAEQIKSTGCNWVRLSHYPHDPDFLDDLDELGLLALAEGPTWMKPGGATWKGNLEASFRSMIRRDRNHPSVIVWNCCINHRGGEKSLVAAAEEEDPTRPRGQHDVPCPMNFSHRKISGNAALVIEHTGHTFATSRGERGQPGKAPVNWVQDQITDNREYEQARRHYEHTDAAYRVVGNAGLAVWAMYDYNTFHNARAGIARHGVADLFRIPKFSYWWHVSELTDSPMAHVVRVNGTSVCVFSNCEEVRLWQDAGGGLVEVATQRPDAGFVLKHPPFHFTVSDDAKVIRADGVVAGTVRATHTWRTPGVAVALALAPDRTEIVADGGDLTRLVVSAVDAEGTVVETCDAEVRFSIEGLGQLVGESPTKLRAGRFIVLAQSGFVPGEIKVIATSPGLRSASAVLRMRSVDAGVEVPAWLTKRQPTANTVVVARGGDAPAPPATLAFESKDHVMPGTWIESDPVMLEQGGAVSVVGGEYRIYTAPWTDQPGKAGGGDAVFVRVRSSSQPGGKASVQLKVGGQSAAFEVTTAR